MTKLDYAFFHRPCLEVAQDLVGKLLVHKTESGIQYLRISETESYCGADDTAADDGNIVHECIPPFLFVKKFKPLGNMSKTLLVTLNNENML